MFGSKKTITDRVKDSLTDYLDEKFDNYRGQIALDLSRGLAALAGLIALWSIAIVGGVFVAVAVSLLLGWLLSFVMPAGSYVLSFGVMAAVVFGGTYYLIKNKDRLIEEPVFNIMSEMLRSPAILAPKEATTTIPDTGDPVHIEHLPITESMPITPDSPNPPIVKENEGEDKPE
jgi:hypothetical protein